MFPLFIYEENPQKEWIFEQKFKKTPGDEDTVEEGRGFF